MPFQAAALPVPRNGFRCHLRQQPKYACPFWATVWLAVSQLVRSALQLGRNFGSEVLGQRLERDARQELYASLLGKSMGFHDSRPTGEDTDGARRQRCP